MSRSVKQDFDKLRTPMHVYQREGGKISYIGVTIPLTDEQHFGLLGGEYARKAVEVHVSPTNEDWGRYHRAKAGLLALQNYDGVLGLEEVEVRQPKPYMDVQFTETNEEWLDRCRSLQAERKAA